MTTDDTKPISESHTSSLVAIIAAHEAVCVLALLGKLQQPSPEDVAIVEQAIGELDRRIPASSSCPDGSCARCVARAERQEQGLVPLELYGVTPPQGDTAGMRQWIEGSAKSSGWTRLEWQAATDRWGTPYSRLVGVRPCQNGAA